LFDVTIVEEVDSLNLAQDHLTERLLDRSGDNITRFLASSLDLQIEQDNPAMFSLDGEMVDFDAVELRNRKQVLSMVVGEGYDECPQSDGDTHADD
jgi:diacylglycerol kinase family enzyme